MQAPDRSGASHNLVVPSNRPARATGHSLGVMAPHKRNDDSADIVMGASAERPATFVQMEDLTPAEVKRLIDLEAVLPPTLPPWPSVDARGMIHRRQ